MPLPGYLYDRLTQDERARADRYRRPLDREQFLAGRLLLQHELRRRFGATGISVVDLPDRKPFLAGAGIPPGFDFNISHSSGLVACASGIRVSVGVDVEGCNRAGQTMAIAAAYFAEEERVYVSDESSFLRLWTIKEAVTKAVGLGLTMPLNDFACAIDPPRLLRTAAQLGGIEQWHLAAWAPGSHVLALAVRSVQPLAVFPPTVPPLTDLNLL